jgi:signal transduction histidine kinase
MASTRRDLPRSAAKRRALRRAAASSTQPFHFSADAAHGPAGGERKQDVLATAPANDVATLRVLVVDDQATRSGTITKQLRSGLDQSLRIETAASGRDAATMLRRQTFDLVLIEYTLPDTSGLELIEQIAELDDRMAMILVTDRGSETLAARAIQSGAVDYLVRDDVTPEALAQAVTTATRTARLEDKNRQRMRQLRDGAESSEHFVRALSHDMSAAMMVLEDSLARVENACREAGISSAINTEFAHVTACLGQSKRLLDDLASLARTGSLAAEPRDVDITQVITKVLYEQNAAIDERGVEVTIAPDLGSVHCNTNRVHQLLTNLVRNALLHGCDSNQPKLSIDPATSYGSDQNWLRVWDNGPGIPRDAREQVFEPGKRFAATAGSGMGLAIVQRIVSQYDGTVMVDPMCGDGTAIIFSLPAGSHA